jgi:hypothetical protein
MAASRSGFNSDQEAPRLNTPGLDAFGSLAGSILAP